MLGGILTSIGAILLAISGVIYLAGYAPLAWLKGLTGLLLGVGLVLFMRQSMRHEAGREARERTESHRREREEIRWKERE